ncbi:hypothetical protein ES319_A08G053000v1 [Gossypium barbadense]|uniref:Uncharacterized protein n=1 Tax=Gossypium barbadense TaxID=3634 RepID=A0A5J5UPQ3_GOSBA|nr:hypothetical protein ES319_A08G053000v1 [Gossypium barbadense]
MGFAAPFNGVLESQDSFHPWESKTREVLGLLDPIWTTEERPSDDGTKATSCLWPTVVGVSDGMGVVEAGAEQRRARGWAEAGAAQVGKWGGLLVWARADFGLYIPYYLFYLP